MPQKLIKKPQKKSAPSLKKKFSFIQRGICKTIYKNKNVFCGMIILTLLGTGLFFADHTGNTSNGVARAQNQTPEPKDFVDLHIGLYSDEHITPSAIVADKNLAENYTYNTNLTASVNQTTVYNPQTHTSTKKEYGTWLWTSPRDMSEKYEDSIISDAKKNDITVIYLSIDTYLDAYSSPDKTQRAQKIQTFTDALEHFVAKAHLSGIAVDAEAGWRNWAEDGNTYKAFAVIDFVKQFNTTQKEKLRGFQYDVEPYLLDEYKKDQSAVLKNYVTLIDESIGHLKGSDLQFSVVIPDFYDDTSKLTDPFTYNGTNTYVFNHLLTVLEKRPESEIIVMAYRNFAKGLNGTIDVANTEMTEAKNTSTKIIVAQETGDVQPPYITYNNTSKKYYDRQIAEVNKAFNGDVDFQGIAVHYVNAFISLK